MPGQHLAINAAVFVAEVGAGLAAGSVSLQSDAFDFLGDAANCGISLFVVGMALRYWASAAMAKGATMGAFGLWVVGTVVWHAVGPNISGSAVLISGSLWMKDIGDRHYRVAVASSPNVCSADAHGHAGTP